MEKVGTAVEFVVARPDKSAPSNGPVLLFEVTGGCPFQRVGVGVRVLQHVKGLEADRSLNDSPQTESLAAKVNANLHGAVPDPHFGNVARRDKGRFSVRSGLDGSLLNGTKEKGTAQLHGTVSFLFSQQRTDLRDGLVVKELTGCPQGGFQPLF